MARRFHRRKGMRRSHRGVVRSFRRATFRRPRRAFGRKRFGKRSGLRKFYRQRKVLRRSRFRTPLTGSGKVFSKNHISTYQSEVETTGIVAIGNKGVGNFPLYFSPRFNGSNNHLTSSDVFNFIQDRNWFTDMSYILNRSVASTLINSVNGMAGQTGDQSFAFMYGFR